MAHFYLKKPKYLLLSSLTTWDSNSQHFKHESPLDQWPFLQMLFECNLLCAILQSLTSTTLE